MYELANAENYGLHTGDPVFDYCQSHRDVFVNFKREVWEILPEFCRLVHHFSNDSGAVVREMINSRSPLEIEILNGMSSEDERLLGDFFSAPIKPSGRPLNNELSRDPILRLLGGAYPEQTVYIREFSNGVRFYAAVWPWRTNPGVLTLHFGVYDEKGGETAHLNFKQFLHDIP